jgi:hypothetical protein
MAKIIMTIGDDLKPVIEVTGHTGPGCADLTAGLEKALAGSNDVDREKKREWFARADAKQSGEVNQ